MEYFKNAVFVISLGILSLSIIAILFFLVLTIWSISISYWYVFYAYFTYYSSVAEEEVSLFLVKTKFFEIIFDRKQQLFYAVQ